jgi:hypothetical protein
MANGLGRSAADDDGTGGEVVQPASVSVEDQRGYRETDQKRAYDCAHRVDPGSTNAYDTDPHDELAERAAERHRQQARLDEEDDQRRERRRRSPAAERVAPYEPREHEQPRRPVNRKRTHPLSPART